MRCLWCEPIIMLVSLLPLEWHRRFKRDLYVLSYDQVVSALLEVVEGRRKPRSPIEIEISPDLSVRTCASPRLRPADGAGEATRTAIRSIEQLLADREEVIRRIARVVANEQRGFFAGDLPSPRALEASSIAARTSLPRSIVEEALRNKLVIHPRGISRLDALVDPEIGPSALLMPVPRPRSPQSPNGSTAQPEETGGRRNAPRERT